MSEPTTKSGLILILVGAVLVIGALVFYFNGQDGDAPSDPAAAEAPVAGEAAEDAAAKANIRALMAPRTQGDTNAATKIVEFSSLTCGHCAKFHGTTYKAIKDKYIDNGQAYVVFVDFPLNRPALDGSMIARCLPANKYVDFINTLFAEQSEWAFGSDYLAKLEVYAANFGMDKTAFDACLDNTELTQAIIAKMESESQKWKIGSTPSFVINDKDILAGNRPIGDFELLFAKGDEAAADAEYMRGE